MRKQEKRSNQHWDDSDQDKYWQLSIAVKEKGKNNADQDIETA